MNIAFCIGPRNREAMQVYDILSELHKNNENHLYLVYNFLETRNTDNIVEFYNIKNQLDFVKFIDINEWTLAGHLDYILVTNPYMFKNNKKFKQFIKRCHEEKTKIIYFPYDLSTSIEQDLTNKNDRYMCLIDMLDYIDTVCCYDCLTYTHFKPYFGSKLVRIGCPRFNGKPKHKSSNKFTIIYNARFCFYSDNNWILTNNSSKIKLNKSEYDSCDSVAANTIIIPKIIDLARKHSNWNFVIRFHPEFYIKNPKEYNYIKTMCSVYDNVIFDEFIGNMSNFWLEKSNCAISEYSSWNMDIIRQNIPCVQIADYHKMLPAYQNCYKNIDVIDNIKNIDKLEKWLNKVYIAWCFGLNKNIRLNKNTIKDFKLYNNNAIDFVNALIK